MTTLAEEVRHGTRSGYVAGCRLDCCREPHRLYMKSYYRRRNDLDGATIRVPAGKVRRYVERLAAQGVGKRTVAELAGCSVATVEKLLGAPSRVGRGFSQGPTRRIHRELAGRILAITVDDIDGGQKIPAAPTWKLLDELIAAGWSRSALARRIYGPHASKIRIRRTSVRASTAAKVRELHDELSGKVPEPRRSRWHPEPPQTPGLACDTCGGPLAEHTVVRPCATWLKVRAL